MENKKIITTNVLIEKTQPHMCLVSDKMEPTGNIRILIVDDERCIREILFREISSMGFEVSVASNGFEALGMLKQGSFGVVLTDLNMPGMDGWLLSHKIKEKYPETYVILTTGEEPEDVIKKLKERYSDYIDSVIFKPFRLEEIDSALERLLNKGQESTRLRDG